MHEKTKVSYMGKRLKVSKTKIKNRAKKGIKVIAKVSFVVAVIYGIYLFGTVNNTTTTYTNNETVREVEVIVEVTKKSAVMERIANCESSSGHYAPSGQVAMNANSNGTVDIGKYQINTVWNKQATALGFDLTVEKDNEEFAMWIYANKGTQPWYSSKKCWMK